MATNTYTYGALGQRWVLQTPTSKANLDIARTKNDANRWTLEALLDDPDDSPFVLANVTTVTVTGPVATAGLLNLWTAETTVVDTDILGRIDFKAPDQTGDGDGVLVTASIYAEADATFSATVNETDIVFATAHDGAAAERLRITSQGEIGLGGANYGTDGQVITSTGAGTAVAWESIPAGTTLSGSTPHTVATVTGANALEGEAALTFDGSTLAVTGALSATGNVSFDGGSFVFNEAGADKDFRIEGDTQANLFVADASADNINLRSATSTAVLSGPPTLGIHGEVTLYRQENNSYARSLTFAKSRGSGVEAVQDDDALGYLTWAGADGTDLVSVGAQIHAEVDNAPGSNDIPARLMFSTTNNGYAAVTERMRIDSLGAVTFASFGKFQYLGSMTATSTWADIAFSNQTNLGQLYCAGRAGLLYYVSFENNNGATGSRSFGWVYYSGNEEGGSGFRGTVTTPTANTSGYHGYANLTFRIDTSKLQVQRSANTAQGWVQFYHQAVAGSNQSLG